MSKKWRTPEERESVVATKCQNCGRIKHMKMSFVSSADNSEVVFYEKCAVCGMVGDVKITKIFGKA